MKKSVLLLASLVGCASFVHANTVSVFLDDGTNAPGSTNTGSPFTTGQRDQTWNITSTAQPGLAGFGAEAMQVRMVTFNINGQSRQANEAGGNGLGVNTGGTNTWMQSNTNQAAAFQFTFFSDAAMTTELTGLNIRFDSFTSRIADNPNLQLLHAYAGSGAFVYSNPDNDNNGLLTLRGTDMTTANDGTLGNLGSSLSMGVVTEGSGSTQYYTIASDAINFSEQDLFWVRRNNQGPADTVYQLAELQFTVIPEPGTYAALFGLVALGAVALRRRTRVS